MIPLITRLRVIHYWSMGTPLCRKELTGFQRDIRPGDERKNFKTCQRCKTIWANELRMIVEAERDDLAEMIRQANLPDPNLTTRTNGKETFISLEHVARNNTSYWQQMDSDSPIMINVAPEYAAIVFQSGRVFRGRDYSPSQRREIGQQIANFYEQYRHKPNIAYLESIFPADRAWFKGEENGQADHATNDEDPAAGQGD